MQYIQYQILRLKNDYLMHSQRRLFVPDKIDRFFAITWLHPSKEIDALIWIQVFRIQIRSQA